MPGGCVSWPSSRGDATLVKIEPEDEGAGHIDPLGNIGKVETVTALVSGDTTERGSEMSELDQIRDDIEARQQGPVKG